MAGWAASIDSTVPKWNGVTSADNPTYKRKAGDQNCDTDVYFSGTGGCGLTTTWSVGSTITAAEIDYRSGVTYYWGSGSGDCQFVNTTLHEFGHAEGLKHTYVTSAVMWHINNGVTNLQTDDVYAITCSYPITLGGAWGTICAQNNPAP